MAAILAAYSAIREDDQKVEEEKEETISWR
jgi:hypothetical protein